jgi:hypothetical protein
MKTATDKAGLEIKWRHNSPLNTLGDSKAKQVHDHIEKLIAKHGQEANLNRVMVEDSKNPVSPLHSVIRNKQGKEAELSYYLRRASDIRSALVEIQLVHGEPTELQVFHNVQHQVTKSKTIKFNVVRADVMENDEYRSQLVAKGKTRLETFCNKYSDVDEFNDIINTIREWLSKNIY